MYEVTNEFNADDLLRLPSMGWIISAQWHPEIMQAIRLAAIEEIKLASRECRLFEFSAPGTLEIPQLIHSGLLRTKVRPEFIIVLGCIVKGDTAHFDLIASTVFKAVNDLALQHHIVITNGILTVNNLQQAKDRAGGSKGNKGREAAQAALSLYSELERIK